MKKKIILLNGPALCGKDTLANLIYNRTCAGSFKYKMALPLKEACHKLLGLEGSLEDLEPLKEKPIKFLIKKDASKSLWVNYKFMNENSEMTLRQFYIHISENVMKPLFGDDIFGRLAVENIANSKSDIITVSDSGFEDEALPIVKHFGENNVCLVKIHRAGRDFKGDSRTYIDLPLDAKYDIDNNGTLQDLLDNALGKIANFLGS